MHENTFNFRIKRIHRTSLQEDQYNLEIYIKETGNGIPAENQKVIFKGFLIKQLQPLFNKGSIQIKG